MVAKCTVSVHTERWSYGPSLWRKSHSCISNFLHIKNVCKYSISKQERRTPFVPCLPNNSRLIARRIGGRAPSAECLYRMPSPVASLLTSCLGEYFVLFIFYSAFISLLCIVFPLCSRVHLQDPIFSSSFQVFLCLTEKFKVLTSAGAIFYLFFEHPEYLYLMVM